MSAARKPAVRPRGLVLVRGGLDARDGDGDDGWEDFCRRIGWQTAAPAPDAEFERRIAEGLFTRPIAPDNVVDLELARETKQAEAGDLEASFADEIRRSFVREIQPWRADEAALPGPGDGPGAAPPESAPRPGERFADAAQANLAPDAEADRLRRGWVRVGAAALTLALAATVLLAVARLAASSARSPAASIVAPSAEVSHAVTAPPPEVAPVRATPPEGPSKPAPTAKPQPKPRTPRDARPRPPGALVARRSLDAPAKSRALAADGPAAAADEPAHDEDSQIDAGEASEGEARVAVASLEALGAEPRAAWGGVRIQADPAASWDPAMRSLVALSAVESAASAKGNGGADVWSSGLPAAEPSAASRTPAPSATWSLSGGRDRWVGASLTPTPPALAPANIGVMMQLDLGRALNKL